MERSAQVIVVGGGPTGLMAALALASARVDTILVRGNPPRDNRTTALLASSKTALETLGVWPRCHAQAAPLEVMRIVDDTGRLWRAPEVQFSAYEIGLDAFAWNIENRHLLAALAAQAAEEPTLRIVFAEALRIDIGETADSNAGAFQRFPHRSRIGAEDIVDGGRARRRNGQLHCHGPHSDRAAAIALRQRGCGS